MNYIIDLLTSYLLSFFNLHTKILDIAVDLSQHTSTVTHRLKIAVLKKNTINLTINIVISVRILLSI